MYFKERDFEHLEADLKAVGVIKLFSSSIPVLFFNRLDEYFCLLYQSLKSPESESESEDPGMLRNYL